MAKYTNTAGFKAISNENTEEPSEKLPRPLLLSSLDLLPS